LRKNSQQKNKKEAKGQAGRFFLKKRMAEKERM